jgi:hypothetical protein
VEWAEKITGVAHKQDKKGLEEDIRFTSNLSLISSQNDKLSI